MSINTLLNRLPSHFNKQITSNNYKALSLVADYIDDSEALYATIQSFWDIDQAVGGGLDRLGKDEGISRGSYDDETYRKMIKIQFIVNMSEGDIDVINTILTAYMGKDFLYVEEGWSSAMQEPAMMLINVSNKTASIPFELVHRIKPAGVRMIFASTGTVDRITIHARQYFFGVPYPITNRFRTTDVNGRVTTTSIRIQEHTHSFGVPYPITNVLRTEAKNGKVASEKVKLQSNAYGFHVFYPICSQFHTASIGIDSQKEYVQVTTEYRSNEVLYKRAGTIFAGEGDI